MGQNITDARHWMHGLPKLDSTGLPEHMLMRNQNAWRWKDNWWRDNESHMTVIYRKSVMREGFAGEQITIPIEQAEHALETGIAVMPDERNVHVLPCFNPETLLYDRPIERTPALMQQIALKRQWIDVYWRIHDAYLETFRQTTGWNQHLETPLTKKEIARLLWQQAQVRINPQWITFRYTNRPNGVTDLGHTWVWVNLPGGSDIASPRLVYNNERVKLRIHNRKDVGSPY
eukprot:TRINITY_DN40272_c0_g1_i1.p2 TRINITY_DN40272_c0_g1~~TRINITY_DN40272_c0_g1_i1.p2  ORF type:complete len:239 (+),score=74.32 TRINITY_DN40272_c0_g1_i1:25-717(+)